MEHDPYLCLNKFHGCPECAEIAGADEKTFVYRLDPATGEEHWYEMPSCSVKDSRYQTAEETYRQMFGDADIVFHVPEEKLYNGKEWAEAAFWGIADDPFARTYNCKSVIMTDTDGGTSTILPADGKVTSTPITKEGSMHSSRFSAEAIQDALDIIADDKRAEESAEILQRISEWGDDTYNEKTVFRFDKAFNAPSATGSYRAACNPGSTGTYSYAAIKFDGGWQAGRERFGSWEMFVIWLVTAGEPVAKDDVEIFPPAKFPAAGENVPAYAE